MDAGDYQLISGPLANASQPARRVESFQARIVSLGGPFAHVTALFIVPGGAAIVQATFNDETGPPQRLPVTNAVGSLGFAQGGSVSLGDTGTENADIFTFTSP